MCKSMFAYIRSSAKHPIVKEESAHQKHSGEAGQVKQITASVRVTSPKLRISRNASKSRSSPHKPVTVSSDSSTPLESPVIPIRNKNLVIHKPLSKASSRSDRSEKFKLAPAGKLP